MTQTNTNTGKCVYCGVTTKGISLPTHGGSIDFPAPECCSAEPCLAKNEAKYQRKLHEDRKNRMDARLGTFIARIPPIYKDTRIEELHSALQDTAAGWTFLNDSRQHSLLLTGKTRCGKSRTAAYVAERLALEHKMEIEFLSMYDLERLIEEGIEGGTHSKHIKRLRDVGILVLDDIGKEMLTKRIASDLFAIIDGRVAYKRPTIITTQHTGSEVASRFNDKTMGDAIVSRLREFYTIISTNS